MYQSICVHVFETCSSEMIVHVGVNDQSSERGSNKEEKTGRFL